MKTSVCNVTVMFADSTCNYVTSVNPSVNNSRLISYFVGRLFDRGIFPEEFMMQCTGIKITRETTITNP